MSACAQLAAFFWVVLVINEKPKEVEVAIINREVFEASSASTSMTGDDAEVAIKSMESIRETVQRHLRELFDLNNVVDIFYTCIKPRSHKRRAQIWSLFMSIACVMLSYMGSVIILWQYVEKLFSWSAKYYSNVNSLVTVFTIISMAVIIPVFMKKYKVRDMLLGKVDFHYFPCIKCSKLSGNFPRFLKKFPVNIFLTLVTSLAWVTDLFSLDNLIVKYESKHNC